GLRHRRAAGVSSRPSPGDGRPDGRAPPGHLGLLGQPPGPRARLDFAVDPGRCVTLGLSRATFLVLGGGVVIDDGGNRTGDAVTLHPATRAALGIGDWLPATRGNIAAHAWRLAYGEQEAAAVGIGTPGMDTSTDLVVGAVEATEEVVIDRLAQGFDADKTRAWLSDEVGGWVRDFLADHATPADPSGQAATCREFGITDP